MQPNYGYAQSATYGVPIPQPAPPTPDYGQPMAPAQQQAFTVPTFREPIIGSGLPTPGARQLNGRACAFFNVEIFMGPGYGAGAPQVEKVRADVLVLDGGPLAWGDDADRGLPPVLAVQQVPYEACGCIFNSSNFIKNLRSIDRSRGDVYLGRVVRGEKSSYGKLPWLITQLGSQLDPYAAHAPQVTAALRDLVTRRFAHGSTLPDNPVPIEINGGPRKDPQQAQPAAPVQPPMQQYAAPAGVVQYSAPVQPAAPVDQPAPGFTPEIWAALSPEQKAMFRG